MLAFSVKFHLAVITIVSLYSAITLKTLDVSSSIRTSFFTRIYSQFRPSGLSGFLLNISVKSAHPRPSEAACCATSSISFAVPHSIYAQANLLPISLSWTWQTSSGFNRINLFIVPPKTNA